jgi:putative membrane protein
MNTVSIVLVSLVALLHFYFLILEMFLWAKPFGRKVFGNSVEKAKTTATLAANQGLYNGFLASGLIWGLIHPDPHFGTQIQFFFLSCVMVAGLYGAYSVSRKILFVQFMPALVAILAIFLSLQ